MADTTILTAIIAGIGVAMVAGPLGCFSVWRRMAYFGDSLAHSGLLGIAIGMVTGIGQHIAIMLVCMLFALLLVWLQQKRLLATDTLLGILAHAALAVGMVVVGFIEHGRDINSGHHDHMDLHSFLFGDILTVQLMDLGWILSGAVTIIAILFYSWRSLVLISVSEELAKAEGIPTFKMNVLLMFMMAIVVSVSINIVGILLITSMLIIPAAAARQIAKTPEMMAMMAGGIGTIAVIVGVLGAKSLAVDTGPAIVVLETLIFIGMMIVPVALQHNKGK